MHIRKALLKLAKVLEVGWHRYSLLKGKPIHSDQLHSLTGQQDEGVQIKQGWHIIEYSISEHLTTVPRLMLSDENGNQIEQVLHGSHSGRNRKLIFFPYSTFLAISDAIELIQFARVSTIEGRARVLLISARYLRDFFSLKLIPQVLFMQFQSSRFISNELLQLYHAGERSYLRSIDKWHRLNIVLPFFKWWYTDIKIAILIESEAQREGLQDLLIPADFIVTAQSKIDINKFDYLLPLKKTETLRPVSILIIKRAIKKAQKQNGCLPTIFYTDHDYINEEGQLMRAPVFKPQANPTYLYCFNYIGLGYGFHNSIIKKTLSYYLNEEGWYYLALDYISQPSAVLGVSEALMSSARTQDPITPMPSQKMLPWDSIKWCRASDSIDSDRGNVFQGIKENSYNCLISAADNKITQPSVDLIIPTRDGLRYLRPCIEGILRKTDYENYSIYIVDNNSEETATFDYFDEIKQHPKINIIEYPGEFNYSAINNFASLKGEADYIALVNNDIEVIHSDWLKQMMAWAVQDKVGVVGAKLLFSDGRIQHAGVTIGMGNAAGHIHRLESGVSTGYQHRCLATQHMMAVTAACLITPRDVFSKVGGLDDEYLAVAYNDIDYCLKVEQLGYHIIWTPEAILYHHESVSRGDDMSEQHFKRYYSELNTFQKRWKTKGRVDKFYSKHLRITDEGVYPISDGLVAEDLVKICIDE